MKTAFIKGKMPDWSYGYGVKCMEWDKLQLPYVTYRRGLIKVPRNEIGGASGAEDSGIEAPALGLFRSPSL
jgi:hypothetical protein